MPYAQSSDKSKAAVEETEDEAEDEAKAAKAEADADAVEEPDWSRWRFCIGSAAGADG